MRFVCLSLIALSVAACQPPQKSAPQSIEAQADTAALADTAATEETNHAEVMAAIASLPAPYNGANYDNGRKVFMQCRSCHLIEAGAGNSVGPNLHGVFGRNAGSLKDYDYSDGVKNSGIIWNAGTLDQWLAQPQTFVPNTRMTFPGIKKSDDRRDVIAYIEIEQAR